jgi:hypothetical protein
MREAASGAGFPNYCSEFPPSWLTSTPGASAWPPGPSFAVEDSEAVPVSGASGVSAAPAVSGALVSVLDEVDVLGGADGVLAMAALAPTEAKPRPPRIASVVMMVFFFCMCVFSLFVVRLDKGKLS